MLAPHLEFRPLGEETALLVSETASAALHGRRYLDLLPLLDGSRSRGDIAAALAGGYSAIEVQTALVALASKGYVVSAETGLSPDAAVFWSALGASPRWAEERLASARISLASDDGRLTAALAEMGIATTADEPTIGVVVCDDYLDGVHAETNRRHLASGLPWMLVSAVGTEPLFGPIFRPADGGPCWACLSHRISYNREVDNFLRAVTGGGAPRLAAPPPFAAAVSSIAAVEIAKWVVLGRAALLHEHAVSVWSHSLSGGLHRVFRRPQCPVCGDKALYRPDRAPVAVALGSSPKAISNSGGARAVPPGETVARYRHLVSPVSGVVTQLVRTSDEKDSWLHVYWAGSNMALKNDSLHLLRTSLRGKSSGKGASSDQAEASALCEAVERRSGAFHGDEIRRRARFEDFAAGEAIEPNAVQLYSDRQYDNAEEINALGGRFNFVPSRFDPSAEIDWTPVWSLTRERHRYLPTSMLYYAAAESSTVYCGPDSNGCASGNTLEEAILQGFFELVERDAFACWWYNRLRLPEVDPDSFGDPYLSGARDYYAACNRDLWMLDLTNDLGIPVFAAVSRRTDKEAEDILFSAGAHLDPHIAAMRAVCELNQYLAAVRDVKADGSGYLYDDPESMWWWRNARLADHPYLALDPSQSRRGAGSYTAPRTADIRDDIEFCRLLVEAKGMEFLVLDQTRPDIGMPVARTIVPGLRHFWPRFAPGRLYDVPVETGRLDEPTAENDLNPVAVFI